MTRSIACCRTRAKDGSMRADRRDTSRLVQHWLQACYCTCERAGGIGDAHDDAGVLWRDVHVVHGKAAARKAAEAQRQRRDRHAHRHAARQRHEHQACRRTPEPCSVNSHLARSMCTRILDGGNEQKLPPSQRLPWLSEHCSRSSTKMTGHSMRCPAAASLPPVHPAVQSPDETLTRKDSFSPAELTISGCAPLTELHLF